MEWILCSFLKPNSIHKQVESMWKDNLWPPNQLPTQVVVSSADSFECLLYVLGNVNTDYIGQMEFLPTQFTVPSPCPF